MSWFLDVASGTGLAVAVALGASIAMAGETTPPADGQAIVVAMLKPPAPARAEPAETPARAGKSGTAFFVAGDGTLLTAAHVVTDCRHLEIVSGFTAKTEVSVLAMDRTQDIALLKADGITSPAVLRIASGPPVSRDLLVLGFPAKATYLTPATSWVGVENQKFPASVKGLADARELLWMSAPQVTPGFSGGPIFDPALGAVTGLVKGGITNSFLGQIPDMPATGVAIGPGASVLSAFLHREVPYAPVVLAAATGGTGEETVRRASVQVLCRQ